MHWNHFAFITRIQLKVNHDSHNNASSHGKEWSWSLKVTTRYTSKEMSRERITSSMAWGIVFLITIFSCKGGEDESRFFIAMVFWKSVCVVLGVLHSVFIKGFPIFNENIQMMPSYQHFTKSYLFIVFMTHVIYYF